MCRFEIPGRIATAYRAAGRGTHHVDSFHPRQVQFRALIVAVQAERQRRGTEQMIAAWMMRRGPGHLWTCSGRPLTDHKSPKTYAVLPSRRLDLQRAVTSMRSRKRRSEAKLYRVSVLKLSFRVAVLVMN